MKNFARFANRGVLMNKINSESVEQGAASEQYQASV